MAADAAAKAAKAAADAEQGAEQGGGGDIAARVRQTLTAWFR